MTVIRFSNLEVTPRSISLRAAYEESIDLWFKFDRDVEVSSTQVALAMATLSGTKYDRVEFDFEVDKKAIQTIAKATRAEIAAIPTEQIRPITSDSGNVLSFSGGFDSLSAWRLMPNDTHLVSLDFGGWFEREAEFFRDFDTLVVTTNARSEPTRTTPLTRNHWSFMAMGAILTANHFNVRYHTFGQILGESMARAPQNSPTLAVLSELGYIEAGYSRGLTEVGTAAVVLQSDPQRVLESLRSLAGPRDRKLYRKTALSAVLANRLGVDLTVPAMDFDKSPKIAFGDDYASSLSALYCIAKGHLDSIEGLFESIPPDVRNLAKSSKFDFMEKVNWDAYASFPQELKPELWERLVRYGLEPYSETDWGEVRLARELLAKYYKEAHR
ncbi:hypothetical protein [Brevibacterium aurantiacum]|uniref:Uncharacterized protein n=1 Tax=Brevibacterium aurantiacum TaxID=273384 RepID=A0A2A3YXS8_BREAU|nr:hypothetical protein [Brevibacterium aurantiacum]PCC44087.1 hypothetical protein CIK65_05750 [Brevibacterium aurantiacum]